MASFYINPVDFMTPKELDRAKATLQRIAEIEGVPVSAINGGGHSTGPKTAEGKARSSRNAVKHGLSSPNPVIGIEDRPAFDAMLDAYMRDWKPAGETETSYVKRAATAMWRYNRAISYEAEILNLEIDYHALPSAAILDPETAGPVTRAAFAFREAATSDPALGLCARYITAAARDYDRAINQLRALQADRRKREAEEEKRKINELPNELPTNRLQPNNSTPKQPIPFPNPDPKPAADRPDQARRG